MKKLNKNILFVLIAGIVSLSAIVPVSVGGGGEEIIAAVFIDG